MAAAADIPTALGSRRHGQGYTSSQPLLDTEGIPVFPIQHARMTISFNRVAPIPYTWAPNVLPEQWVYTDGSDITGHPRLGAAVVLIPSHTTIYIDVAGTYETPTIMRVELVVMHTALFKFATHE